MSTFENFSRSKVEEVHTEIPYIENMDVAAHAVNRKSIIKSMTVSIPGTAGELVQGRFHDGTDFLITNPVDCRSAVSVILREGGPHVAVFPAHKTKAYSAVLATLQQLNSVHFDVTVYIASDIPSGKGMASSTADIVGATEATILALGQTPLPEQVSRIAIAIEPSDGIMYRGVVAYNHRQGDLLEHFGPPPSMQQLIIDLGGEVNTIEFNQKVSKAYYPQEIEELTEAFCLVRDGIKTKDLTKIGRAASMSTRMNQRFLPKPNLEQIFQIAEQAGAYGVACAHSGTILSLLFSLQDTNGPEKASRAIEERFRGQLSLFLTQTVACW